MSKGRVSSKATVSTKATGHRNNFVLQGSLLAVAGILVRIIGMVYRIPLTAIISDEGNGYYTSAFSIYTLLLILSSYSMPTAISKLISQNLEKPYAAFALRALAPTVWIMAYLGLLRGYFQGMGNMIPTAISQILEQIANAIVSVLMAYVLFAKGQQADLLYKNTEFSYAYGAMG
ncbi:MAG: oligosaccharide flippase family protein, partial [Oribacterium parvum]|uniref:oligosaccharide flippase family protein n=1 Tax=Oribacterium parvum TaxID=1501329 RepID=UPI001CB1A241